MTESNSSRDKLNRQLRSGVQDEQLAELVVNLYEDDKPCQVQEGQEAQEPRIICSLGLVEKPGFSEKPGF